MNPDMAVHSEVGSVPAWQNVTKVGSALTKIGIAVGIITLLGSVAVVASPALPAAIGVALLLCPPMWALGPGIPAFCALMFYLFPKAIAISVFALPFIVPFGITVGSMIGFGLVAAGVGALLHYLGTSQLAKTEKGQEAIQNGYGEELSQALLLVGCICCCLQCFSGKK